MQGSFPVGLVRIIGPAAVQRHASPRGSAVLLSQQMSGFTAGGAGTPMSAEVRQLMEGAFATTFADVRIHVGMNATSIGAAAFTQGTHIYFAPGRYSPSTPHGRELLAHELAHVVQQRSGRVRNPFGKGVAVVHDAALEAEADRLARQVMQRQRPLQPHIQPYTRRGTIQRSSESEEDKKKREARAKRFAPDLDLLNKEKAAKQKIIDDLRAKVQVLMDDLKAKKVKTGAAEAAYKHHYKDPITEFLTWLPKASWAETEAAYNDGKKELTVTLHMGGKNTVVGVYDSANNLTVIHCGETASGIGYGTNLKNL